MNPSMHLFKQTTFAMSGFAGQIHCDVRQPREDSGASAGDDATGHSFL